MVSFQDKPIIDYILGTMIASQIQDIVLITGYQHKILKKYLAERYADTPIKFFYNDKYDKTNMVSTLFCAEKELNDDVIISYADIVYKKEILEKLIQSKADISVVVDKNWRQLWELRMENPLEDAETLKLDDQGNILELGQKPRNYKDIQGQYIGLIKISKHKIKEVLEFYNKLPRDHIYDGKDFGNMYMTTFIQLLINNNFQVNSLLIDGGWVEIDTTEDLQNLKYYRV